LSLLHEIIPSVAPYPTMKCGAIIGLPHAGNRCRPAPVPPKTWWCRGRIQAI